ncbi:hypothetical protein [Streptomyces sp. NPDC002054]|uniref:ATP-grasp domain-containing protein n=1 Tax=Streptomyces sp. NPDC002054 TaxID=3154663 RepID=UPI0033173767
MSTARIAIVTSEVGIEEDAELPLIVDALRAAGSAAEAVAWDADPAVWAGFDLAVIRSTWDYTDRLDAFLAWADTASRATRLWNPAPVVRWNSDKRYLRSLAEAGVPVVPTRFLAPGDRVREEDFDTADTGLWADGMADGMVVKPTVSAGARDTARYEPGRTADAVSHARMLLDRERAVMVQPYLRGVEAGERALVFFSGSFSHAIRKQPLLTEPGVIDNNRVAHPGAAPYRPTEAELHTARAALAAVPSPTVPLIARVDLALNGHGDPVVMELELIEPNLFLDTTPDAVHRFTKAVIARS